MLVHELTLAGEVKILRHVHAVYSASSRWRPFVHPGFFKFSLAVKLESWAKL